MFSVKSINAEHKDLIHDVAFDFYGKRMATCSSDQTVKIWDLPDDGQWICTASWKAHNGSVWKINWGHPEFGQIIATCSFDRTASVWEEIVGESTGSDKGLSHWIKRSSLVDSRTSVTDVKFAPKHLGLQLATSSADGIVRIYDAPDVTNLSQWSLNNEIQCRMSCSCLSWNPSQWLWKLNKCVFSSSPAMLAIGSDDPNPVLGGKVFIYEYSDSARRWMRIETIVSITDAVHDLAFAPSLGRSYHVLAVASKDVNIIILKPLRQETNSSASSDEAIQRFEVLQTAHFSDHNSTVWRTSWNITGTILASSGDDGHIRLWKANYLNEWRCISVIKGDSNNVQPDLVIPQNSHAASVYFGMASSIHR
uniref:Nucleoporin SEH1 n=1 Tax=Strigamia maritima TaxID=126957 RepID=T1IJ16_STRMM